MFEPASRPKITSSGCRRSALPITFGHDDVALELVDAEEEEHDPNGRERVHDERVDRRRHRTEPRTEVWQHLGQRHPAAEDERVGLSVRQQPGDAEDVEPEPRARADDQRRAQSGLARTETSACSIRDTSGRPPCGGKRRSTKPAEPLHADQHVDRDDEDQHSRRRAPGRSRWRRLRRSRRSGWCTCRRRALRIRCTIRCPLFSILIERRWCVLSQCWRRSTSRSAETWWVCPCSTVKYALKRSAAVFV